jgi:hypothetical protein
MTTIDLDALEQVTGGLVGFNPVRMCHGGRNALVSNGSEYGLSTMAIHRTPRGWKFDHVAKLQPGADLDVACPPE